MAVGRFGLFDDLLFVWFEVDAELQALSKGNRCESFLDTLPAAFQAFAQK